MNKSWFYLGAIGSLAILITSCGGGDENKAATPAASPNPAVSTPKSPSTTAAAPASIPPTSTPLTIPKPTVAGSTPPPATGTAVAVKPVSVDVAAGLIQPTDGDTWAKTVAKGRLDPFGTLALQPFEGVRLIDSTAPTAKTRIANKNSAATKSGVKKPLTGIESGTTIASKPSTAKQIPKSGVKRDLPKLTVALKPIPDKRALAANQKPIVALKPLPPRGNLGSKPKLIVALKPLPQPLKPTSKVPTLIPTATQPKLARTVGISGVIEIGGKTQVIVKLPHEPFSRYVEVGDRIYDGKITIKRVEGEQTLSPIVVLEEVGVEVTRRVGDTAAPITPDSPPKN